MTRRLRLYFGGLAFCALISTAALSQPDRDALLQVPQAYRVVAGEYGVPQGLLFAIALTESNRPNDGTDLPWPWTLNVDGQSRWYASRAAALADLEQLLAAGETPDIGLMQVNWRYHQRKLSQARLALDPWLNLRAGAAVLAAEYRATNDWWQAVGRYHSRTPRLAQAYRARVLRWYKRIG